MTPGLHMVLMAVINLVTWTLLLQAIPSPAGKAIYTVVILLSVWQKWDWYCHMEGKK